MDALSVHLLQEITLAIVMIVTSQYYYFLII